MVLYDFLAIVNGAKFAERFIPAPTETTTSFCNPLRQMFPSLANVGICYSRANIGLCVLTMLFFGISSKPRVTKKVGG